MLNSLPQLMTVLARSHSPTTHCFASLGVLGRDPALTLGVPSGCFTLTRLGRGSPDRNPSI
eukprot:8188828-Heterocapsa_arctica.AAC.1